MQELDVATMPQVYEAVAHIGATPSRAEVFTTNLRDACHGPTMLERYACHMTTLSCDIAYVHCHPTNFPCDSDRAETHDQWVMMINCWPCGSILHEYWAHNSKVNGSKTFKGAVLNDGTERDSRGGAECTTSRIENTRILVEQSR